MDNFPLKDVVFPYEKNEHICTWDYIPVNEDVRIYYRPRGESDGFYFYSIGIRSRDYDDITECGFMVETLFWGAAFFEGIRHLYMGNEQTDDDEYSCYPNITRELIPVLHGLRKLEEQYCDVD